MLVSHTPNNRPIKSSELPVKTTRTREIKRYRKVDMAHCPCLR